MLGLFIIILISMDLLWFYLGEDFLNFIFQINYLKFYPTNLKSKNSYSLFQYHSFHFPKGNKYKFFRNFCFLYCLYFLWVPPAHTTDSWHSLCLSKEKLPQNAGWLWLFPYFRHWKDWNPLDGQCMVTHSLTALQSLYGESHHLTGESFESAYLQTFSLVSFCIL